MHHLSTLRPEAIMRDKLQRASEGNFASKGSLEGLPAAQSA